MKDTRRSSHLKALILNLYSSYGTYVGQGVEVNQVKLIAISSGEKSNFSTHIFLTISCWLKAKQNPFSTCVCTFRSSQVRVVFVKALYFLLATHTVFALAGLILFTWRPVHLCFTLSYIPVRTYHVFSTLPKVIVTEMYAFVPNVIACKVVRWPKRDWDMSEAKNYILLYNRFFFRT